MKKRSELIDIAKGVAILMVVAGHTPMPGMLKVALGGIPVPLFFILSGYVFNFYKYKDTFGKYASSRVLSLIIPYFTAGIFTWLFLFMLSIAGRKQVSFTSQMKGLIIGYGDNLDNVPLWFLPCLFCAQLIYWVIHKYTHQNFKIHFIVIVIVGIMGTLLGEIGNLFWNIDVSLTVQPFLFMGYKLKEVNLLKKIVESRLILISCILVYVCSVLFNGAIDLYGRVYNHAILFYFIGSSGSLIALILCNNIKKLDLLKKTLIMLGQHSFALLSLHYIVGNLTVLIIIDILFGITPHWLVLFIGSVCVCLVVSKVVTRMLQGLTILLTRHQISVYLYMKLIK